jgi:5-(carboxyamino)imidazole ribonucleotide mutase
VGTLALDKAGAKNAAWLAAQILALNDPALAQRLKAERAGFIAAVDKAAAAVEQADAERRAAKPGKKDKEAKKDMKAK